MQRMCNSWFLAVLTGVFGYLVAAFAAPHSTALTKTQREIERCEALERSGRYEQCFRCADAVFRTIRRKPPDLLWLIGSCGEQSALQIKRTNARVDRLVDAFYGFDQYLLAEYRAPYTLRAIHLPKRMRAIQSIIRRYARGVASTMFVRPSVPRPWMSMPYTKAIELADRPLVISEPRRPKSFKAQSATLPLCQYQALWFRDRFDDAFIVELIAIITAYPDVRLEIALPKGKWKPFMSRFEELFLRIRTDPAMASRYEFPTRPPLLERDRYFHAIDEPASPAPEARITVRHSGVSVEGLSSCQEIRSAVVWAEGEAAYQRDRILRPIEEHRAYADTPAPAPVEAPAAVTESNLDPNAREYLATAAALARDGQYDTAIARAREMLKRYPHAPDVLASLVVWQATVKQCDGAVDVYKTLTEVRVSVANDIHHAAAVCARILQQPDVALEAMERSVTTSWYADPDEYLALADAFWTLAQTQREEGKEPWIAIDKAKLHYREYLRRDSDERHRSNTDHARVEERLQRLASGIIPEQPQAQTPEDRAACYRSYQLLLRRFVRKADGTMELRLVPPPDGTPCPPLIRE